MSIDPRVIGLDEIDTRRSVLTDAHSLSVLANGLNSLTLGAQFVGGAAQSLAHIVQCLVLYEVLIVDSILLDTRADVVRAVELFPEVIKGVYLRWGIRDEVGSIVEQVARWAFV